MEHAVVPTRMERFDQAGQLGMVIEQKGQRRAATPGQRDQCESGGGARPAHARSPSASDANMRAYAPRLAISSGWVPCSWTRPPRNIMTRLAVRTVERRWEIR